MRRRRVVSLAAVGLALACFGAQISSAADTAQSTATPPAARSLSNCVSQNQKLALVALVDQSRSIASTDRGNFRGPALKAALAGLAQSVSEPDESRDPPRIDILIAGFANDVTPGSWQRLTPDSLDEIREQVDSVTATNTLQNTNIVAALGEARRLLLERAPEQDSCRAVILLTDGGYKLLGSDNKTPLTAEMNAGDRALCDRGPRGILTGYGPRRDDIFRFVVGLNSGGISQRDRSFLMKISEGRRGCGTGITRLTGAFVPAVDGPRLYMVFGNLLAQARGGLITGNGEFRTVLGVERFVLTSYSPGGKLVLSGPDDSTATFAFERDGAVQEEQVSGVKLEARWDGENSVRVTGEFQPGSPAAAASGIGTWSFAFPAAGSKEALSRVALYAALRPAFAGGAKPKPAILGSAYETRVNLVSKQTDGGYRYVSDGPLLDATTLRVSLVDPLAANPGEKPPIPAQVIKTDSPGQFIIRTRIDPKLGLDPLRLEVVPVINTPKGVTITPSRLVATLPVVLPPGQGYPDIAPSSIDLGEREGAGSVSARFQLVAEKGFGGTGTACVLPSDVRGPSDAPGAYQVRVVPEDPKQAKRFEQRGRCVDVPAGGTVPMKAEVDVREDDLGSLRIRVPVRVSSSVAQAKATRNLDLGAHLSPEANTPLWLAIVALLVLAGALIPLILIHRINAATAKFQDLDATWVNGYRVELAGGTWTIRGRIDAPARGDESLIQNEMFSARLIGAATDRHRVDSIEGVSLRTHASGDRRDGTLNLLSLFRGPFATARTIGGTKVYSGSGGDSGLRSWRSSRIAEMPLSLGESWVFAPDLAGIGRAGSAPVSAPSSDPFGGTSAEAVGGDAGTAAGAVRGNLFLFTQMWDDSALTKRLKDCLDNLAARDWTAEAEAAAAEDAEAESNAESRARSQVDEPVGSPGSHDRPPSGDPFAASDPFESRGASTAGGARQPKVEPPAPGGAGTTPSIPDDPFA